MKKAVGLVELLVVLIVILLLSIMFLHSPSGRKNPFEEVKNAQTQSQIIDEKINSIEQTKLLRQKIEDNLKEGY